MRREFAAAHRVHVVLKGHRTIVAGPENRTFINLTGNAGMATGGTGDLLTGMIAAWFAQLLDAEAACKSRCTCTVLPATWPRPTKGKSRWSPADIARQDWRCHPRVDRAAARQAQPGQRQRIGADRGCLRHHPHARRGSDISGRRTALPPDSRPAMSSCCTATSAPARPRSSVACASGLGAAPDEVSSPTFTLVQEYRGRLPLYHVDLYRLDPREVDDLGLEELVLGDGVVAIEWAERWAGRPDDVCEVRIESRARSSAESRSRSLVKR